MATGGKETKALKEYAEDIDEQANAQGRESSFDLSSAIKGIVIAQHAFIRGECPNKHERCLKPECWEGRV